MEHYMTNHLHYLLVYWMTEKIIFSKWNCLNEKDFVHTPAIHVRYSNQDGRALTCAFQPIEE